jgi:hypothetical protein
MKYKIWNKQDDLITPIGEVLTKEDVFDRYPMARLENMKFIVCDAPISMGVFMEFEQTKEQYKQMGAPIEEGMTDQEVLDAITYFEENPPELEPTAEERIASMLEFQVMMMIPMEGEI